MIPASIFSESGYISGIEKTKILPELNKTVSKEGRRKAEALADYAVACMEFKDNFILSEKSIKYFTSAVRNDPRAATPLRILTTYWRRQSKNNELLKQFSPIAESHPEAVDLILIVTESLIENNQRDKAILLLEKSLGKTDLNDNSMTSGEEKARMLLLLTHLYAEKKDWDSGEELLDCAVEVPTLKDLITTRLAAALFYAECADQGPDGFFAGWSKRRYRKKLELNLKVLEDFSSREGIHVMNLFPLLDVYKRYSMNDRAENLILSQLLLKPNDAQMFIILAKVFDDNKNYANAFRVWRMIVNSPKYTNIKRVWKAVAKQINASSNLYFQLGYAALKSGNWEEAVKAFDWGLLNNPENSNVLFQLGFAYMKMGKFKKALYQFEKIDQEAQSNYFMAYCYRQLGEYEKSLNALDRAEYLDLKLKEPLFVNKDFYMEYIYIADKAKKYDKVEKVILKLLEKSPDDPNLNNFLGYLWADQNKHLLKAEEMIKKALDSDDSNEAFLDSMAWVLYRKKDYKLAEKYINKALAVSCDILPDAVIRDHAGDIYYALGRKKEALKQWQLSIETYSDDIDPEKIMEKIANLTSHR
jgi:tetratricopeptide (TPR) repeat protein